MKPLAHRTQNPDFLIRPYESRDRKQIRHICCETGFLGTPIDSVFGDRDLFADYLTRYYTDVEPESTWVGEKDGVVVGYLTACGRWNLHRCWSVWNNLRMAFKAGWRFISGQYDRKDRKFLTWILTKGCRESPRVPARAGHFHFNSLEGHRKIGIARDLVITFFNEFQKRGVSRIYGQIVSYDNRRTDRVYEYLGMKVMDKRLVTKYKDRLDKNIYLTTVLKEF